MSDLARAQRRLEQRKARLGIVPYSGDAAGRANPLGPHVATLGAALADFQAEAEQRRETPRAPTPAAAKREAETRGDSPQFSAKGGRGMKGGRRAAAAEAPEVDTEPAGEDPGYALVPEGEYEVALRRCVLRQQWSRWTWICWFQVVEGGELGTEIAMYLARPPKEKERRARRGWKLSAVYAIATGRRPPRNIARLNPETYLASKVFLAKVVTVERDQFGSEVPHAARYSKVKRLVRPMTGKLGGPS